jgi:predicted O-methyltransferase YrrM
MFKITKKSLDINKEISEKMEEKTFHFHTHILYDIRTYIGEASAVKYLEIGAYAGGSASLMCSHPYQTNCFSIDLSYPIDQGVVERNVNKFKRENNSFKYIKGNSQSSETVNIVKEKVGMIDILFIDGDHSKGGVIADYLNYSPLVRKGGYLIFDDYLDSLHSPEVKVVVDEMLQSGEFKNYDIIGSLKYDILYDFSDMESSNLFILKKK